MGFKMSSHTVYKKSISNLLNLSLTHTHTHTHTHTNNRFYAGWEINPDITKPFQ
mgnify:CR=1 FL=1